MELADREAARLNEDGEGNQFSGHWARQGQGQLHAAARGGLHSMVEVAAVDGSHSANTGPAQVLQAGLTGSSSSGRLDL